MEHKLKILPQYFKAVQSGEKTFELRKNDRGFKVGDKIILQEYEPFKDGVIKGRYGLYTGQELEKEISYILTGGQYGLEEGYCILGLEDVRKIKCCNVACKYNSAKCIKKDTGNMECDDYGYCNFSGEINLIPFECSECGDLDEGIECETFEFKPQLQKGED